jgi:hypothetical protein
MEPVHIDETMQNCYLHETTTLGECEFSHGIRDTLSQDIVNERTNDSHMRAGIPYFTDIMFSYATFGKDGYRDTFHRRFQSAQCLSRKPSRPLPPETLAHNQSDKIYPHLFHPHCRIPNRLIRICRNPEQIPVV